MGSFMLPNGKTASGILDINERKSLLRLHLKEHFPNDHDFRITGASSSGEYITLLQCGFQRKTRSMKNGGDCWHEAEIFIHHILKGKRHFCEDNDTIDRITFTSTDLDQVFSDDTAFGSNYEASQLIDAAVSESKKHREVEIGEDPILLYYTGKNCIFKVETAIGNVSVGHQVSIEPGSTKGIGFKSTLFMDITPSKPVRLGEARDLVNQASTFISYISGRPQKIKSFQIRTIKLEDKRSSDFTVIPTHPWMDTKRNKEIATDWRDAPLSLLQDRKIYPEVFTRWMALSQAYQGARIRYLGCLSKGKFYDIDRIVAAANMFDILPDAAFPAQKPLTQELADARDMSSDLFRRLPDGVDRNSILSSLGRLGKPSLPKKVQSRAKIITDDTGDRFAELSRIASIAVKLRNFYVHGSEIDYKAIEPYQVFLTETLEFIFFTSELIECGWSMQEWLKRSHSYGHKLSEYVVNYAYLSSELLKSSK